MIIAANLKTNHTRASVKEYLDTTKSYIAAHHITSRAVVFPPASALTPSRRNITVGAQNAWAVTNGSFTGEIGSDQLDEFNIKTILIGHSERRHIVGEGLELVRRKFDYFAGLCYEIFLCVGEPLEIKEAGFDAVLTYIHKQLDGIDISYEKLVLAYEPVWAIGTGKTATSNDISVVHQAIKQLGDRPLLYGGSVKVENAGDILSISGVDGVLVGTTSWQAGKYCELLAESNNITKAN